MKFNEGDKYRMLGGCAFIKDGDIVEITRDSDISAHYKSTRTDAPCSGHESSLVKLITQGEKTMKRTFRLLKDTPGVKKNALYQEECEDGTQPYKMITSEYAKGPNNKYRLTDRCLVEEQPEWFVEVFQVEPQYMTREELDKWEAFKANKPVKQVKAPTKGSPLNGAEKTMIHQLHKAGMSNKAISEKIGRSDKSVARVLSKKAKK